MAIGWQLRSRLHPGQPHARPGGAVIDKQELINIPTLPKFIPAPKCFEKLSQIANKHKLCGSINEALSFLSFEEVGGVNEQDWIVCWCWCWC